MRRFISRQVSFALVVASILALPGRSSAEVRPHFSRGTAVFVSPTDFVGLGNATHLGLYDEVGHATFTPTSDPAVFLVDGFNNYKSANGDELCAVFTGQLNGATGAITATLTYVGGTGRFHDATGSADLSGQIQSDGSISVTVKGTIDY